VNARRTINRTVFFAIVAGLSLAGLILTLSAPARSASSDAQFPQTLITPLTGTSLDRPARDTSFLCGAGPFAVMTNASTPWVSGNVIDVSQIPHVEGSVTWKSKFAITTTATKRRLKGNGLPITKTGEFPVKMGTPAYSYYAALPAQGYDNAAEIPIRPWDLDITVRRWPRVNRTPACISKLTMGVADTGAPWHVEIAPDAQYHILNPSAGLPMDRCWGHPYATQYHYHGESWTCFANRDKPHEHSPLVGYAIDGFGVYGIRGVGGKPVTNSQLDECHGHTHRILWEGKMVRMYHYHLNNEYPYSIGCFRGTPAILPRQAS
jgi:hypothetical protein